MAKMQCPQCGKEVDEQEKICPNCMYPLHRNPPTQEESSRQQTNLRCPRCGNQIDASMKWCPNCGASLTGDAPTSESGALSKFEQIFDAVRSFVTAKRKIVIPVAIVAVVLVVIAICVNLGSSDKGDNLSVPETLSNIYYTYLDSSYATLGYDNSYLTIDTNPSDYDDYQDEDAFVGLAGTISLLNLPDSLAQKMGQTRALDGMQRETYGDIEVSWTYHPDSGLEVMFSEASPTN